MRITCGIREVVLGLVLVHPSRFKEPTIVLAGVNWLSIRIGENQFLNVAVERMHVVLKFSNARIESNVVSACFHGLVCVLIELPCSPALQLASPDS